MKSSSSKTLQILSAVFVGLFLAGVVGSIIQGELTVHKFSDDLFLFFFLILLLGFALSWRYPRWAGLAYLVWIAGVWIIDLYLDRGQDSGMVSIMAVPALVIGVFHMLRWYKVSRIPEPSLKLQWKYILRVLLIIYTVLYSIVVFSELVAGNPPEFLHFPILLFPLLGIIYLLGFALSWRWEFVSGIIFSVWCAILLSGAIAYDEIRNAGPWIAFGIPILLQAIFYVKNHFEFRTS
jgi:hypothetical protein